jgi:hypothetical protein
MSKSKAKDFNDVFQRLRGILARHAASFDVTSDTPTRYCLEAAIGPATLQSWRGKVRRPNIPVAWVETGKAYVSYHLMGVALPSVRADIPEALEARMQGTTCFNFTATDPLLIEQLDELTGASMTAFRKSGFIV